MRLPPSLKDWTGQERQHARRLLSECLGAMVAADRDGHVTAAMLVVIEDLRVALDLPRIKA
jgi:hypothetical protein